MATNTSSTKSPPPKLTQIRIDEVREYGQGFKASWHKRTESAKGSVANVFRNARGSIRKSEQHVPAEERLGPRPVSRRTKAPTKVSVPVPVPAFDISDDVLAKLTNEPTTVARRPTSKFFHKQRQRAGITETSNSSIPPSQAELDCQPLEAEDIIYMFAGAPYFDVEEDAGHQEPRVVYGWGPTNVEPRDATDYAQAKHKSFRVRTIDERYSQRNISAKTAQRRRIREIPSMLSADGKDASTVGFKHFLELPLRQRHPLDENSIHAQHLLLEDPESLGLRTFDIENVADRLSELSKVYEMLRAGKGEAAEWDQYMIEDIGEDLFTTLLSADLGATPAGTGSVSLRTQISALQKVLSLDGLWFDFSDENWRNRLGQLVWQPRDIVVVDSTPLLNERDLLLLQISLSAELAVRFEIAQRLAASGYRVPSVYAPGDFDAMMREQSEQLDWTIVAFQRFIQCFETSATGNDSESSLRRLSQNETNEEWIDYSSEDANLVFRLRKEREQWDGLHAFATTLGWPDSEASKVQPALSKFDSFLTPPTNQRPDSYASEYGTPLSSPVTTPLPPPGEGTPALVLMRSQKALLAHSAFDDIIATRLQDVGITPNWITKSWLSGFMMPGSVVDQFLLHTLLATSPAAKSLIPESLNMHDGFVHRKQMYWSKESVVGRVLAPTTDAKECSGWVSLPFVPQSQGNGWVQAMVKDAPYALIEPRISTNGIVSRTSDPLHSYDSSELQAGDFATVLDGPLVMGNEAQFHGVSLASTKMVQQVADGYLVPKTVNLTFKSPRNAKMAPLTLPLTHAVYFVSSQPCHPYTRRRANGTSPATHDPGAADSSNSSPSSAGADKVLPAPPAHPLHVDYTYTIIPAAALLSSEMPEVKDSDSLILMESADDDSPSTYQIEDQEVVVLDCRGSSDLEVLARAWCSKVGENALVGYRERTCLACCIREAIGLGIGVVIRTS